MNQSTLPLVTGCSHDKYCSNASSADDFSVSVWITIQELTELSSK